MRTTAQVGCHGCLLHDNFSLVTLFLSSFSLSLQFAPLFTFFVGGISSPSPPPPRTRSSPPRPDVSVFFLWHVSLLPITRFHYGFRIRPGHRASLRRPSFSPSGSWLLPRSSSPLGELRFPCNRPTRRPQIALFGEEAE